MNALQHARTRSRQWFGGVFLLALLIGFMLKLVPLLLLITYGGMSLVAFAAYAFDKSAAMRNQWRTPESTLHLMGLLGGWPGALLAQGLLRHKSSKPGFQWVCFATVILNLVALSWLFVSGHVDSLNRAVFAA